MRSALLILITFLSCASVQRNDESDVILWQENRLLSWDDFKGRPQRRFAGASTHYNMVKELTDKETYAVVEVKALFYTEKSWKKPLWVNESLLAHEQKHFDIVELFSRKLRRMIQEETYPGYKDLKLRTDSMYDVIDKQMDLYQDQYDDETNGSMYGEGQRAWNKKIMEEIHALEKFKTVSWEVKFMKP
jgi:hypothetical protein